MNRVDYFRLAGALLFAALTIVLVLTAGLYGQTGAWILGTFVSTFLIAIFGGHSRVLLTAVATAPPFILIYVEEIRLSHSEPLGSIMLRALGAFGLTVALPLLIAFGVAYFTRNSRNV